jgi:putative oxidoreductase
MFKSLSKYSDVGLLIGRIGVGAIFIFFGWHKLFAGQSNWTKIGQAIGSLGIHFYPMIWGLMASLAEFGGGIFLVLGLFFRPAAILLALTMFVAFVSSFKAEPHNFTYYSRPLEMLCIALVFLFVGPGKYSIDRG